MTGSLIFFSNLRNRKDPSNSNYHMSIKNCQAIQRSCIDRKSNAWFKLGSESETMVCDTSDFFWVDCRSRFSNHYMTGSLIFFPSNSNYHMSIKNCQAIQKSGIDRKSNVWLKLGSESETMVCDTLDFFGSTCRSRFQITK